LAFDTEFPSYLILDKFVTDLIPSAVSTVWGNVKVRHLIDMASGVYSLASFEGDEGSTGMSNGFFLRETNAQRLDYCLTYGSKKAAPGTFWVYTTCQAYLVSVIMRNAVASQAPTVGSWNSYLVSRLYAPLSLSFVTRQRKITYESLTAVTTSTLFQEIGGYGEFMVLDDMAKIARFLNFGEGKISGVQKLTYSHLKAALQRDSSDRGFSVSGLTFPAYYNNFVWATDVYGGLYNTQTTGCGGEYEPYMSGYGGITIALLKSKLNYLAVSDDLIYATATTLTELAAHVRLPCASTYSP
jgi:CubicO group peptidase (beta-lactamase class C family)